MHLICLCICIWTGHVITPVLVTSAGCRLPISFVLYARPQLSEPPWDGDRNTYICLWHRGIWIGYDLREVMRSVYPGSLRLSCKLSPCAVLSEFGCLHAQCCQNWVPFRRIRRSNTWPATTSNKPSQIALEKWWNLVALECFRTRHVAVCIEWSHLWWLKKIDCCCCGHLAEMGVPHAQLQQPKRKLKNNKM